MAFEGFLSEPNIKRIHHTEIIANKKNELDCDGIVIVDNRSRPISKKLLFFYVLAYAVFIVAACFTLHHAFHEYKRWRAPKPKSSWESIWTDVKSILKNAGLYSAPQPTRMEILWNKLDHLFFRNRTLSSCLEMLFGILCLFIAYGVFIMVVIVFGTRMIARDEEEKIPPKCTEGKFIDFKFICNPMHYYLDTCTLVMWTTDATIYFHDVHFYALYTKWNTKILYHWILLQNIIFSTRTGNGYQQIKSKVLQDIDKGRLKAPPVQFLPNLSKILDTYSKAWHYVNSRESIHQ